MRPLRSTEFIPSLGSHGINSVLQGSLACYFFSTMRKNTHCGISCQEAGRDFKDLSDARLRSVDLIPPRLGRPRGGGIATFRLNRQTAGTPGAGRLLLYVTAARPKTRRTSAGLVAPHSTA